MKINKFFAVLFMAAIMVSSIIFPQNAFAATKYDGWEVTGDNGVTAVGKFDSLTSGYLVFYPSDMKESDKTYPLISWANGTLCAPGLYYNLLSEIAAGGYIVVANTELMSADGKAQIASIDYMLTENEDESSAFYHKINADKIGVAGHSQGGRSSVNAAVSDSRIDCVFSIAGSNLKSEAKKLTTPTFFATGTADLVVLSSLWVKPSYNNCKGQAVYASLKGAIHTTCCTSPAKYSGYAIKWFDAYLKNDTDALGVFLPGGTLSKDSNWTGYKSKNY